MPRQDQIGFWRRFRSLLNEERHQFFLRHRGQGHDSPLRPNRAAEGVAQRSSCVFRAGEGRGCNFRIGRRVSASVVVCHGNWPLIDCFLRGVAAYRDIISTDSVAGATCLPYARSLSAATGFRRPEDGSPTCFLVCLTTYMAASAALNKLSRVVPSSG